MKVMVVDDEPDMLFILQTILGREYEVITAETGEECLDKLRRIKPDLILLDVMMPGMDGWKVCEKIKSSDATKDIKILMLTVKSREKVRGYELADGYLHKPVDKRMLLHAVHRILGA